MIDYMKCPSCGFQCVSDYETKGVYFCCQCSRAVSVSEINLKSRRGNVTALFVLSVILIACFAFLFFVIDATSALNRKELQSLGEESFSSLQEKVVGVEERLKQSIKEMEVPVATTYSFKQWASFERSEQCVGASWDEVKELEVVGSSMLPTFKTGDIVLYKPLNVSRKVVRGDIVWIKSGGESFVHRVLDLYGDEVYTQGDNNAFADGAFSLSAIEGVVCGVVY